MGIEIFSSDDKYKDRFALTAEEARKRGLTSPGGIFALLGELDYYRLIEKLIRGPITESQLITPYRMWLFLKGMAIASVITIMVLTIRFCLLVTGEHVNYLLKFMTFNIFKAVFLYGNAVILLSYITYPKGAVYNAVRYSLMGYSVGIIVSEIFFFFIAMLSLFFKPWVEVHLYQKNIFLDALLEIWYNSYIGSILDETLSLILVFVVVICSWHRLRRLKELKQRELDIGRPYDLKHETS